ncbi:MlaD family protein [Microbaculum marinum]|uniref:MlaD family protein n=1 Tax=Microbaculum marinum TaxID=1764581 RepID=A0AAW9RUF7_9HYPH
MEIRASPFIVGLFTLAVVAGAFGFIYWIGTFADSAGNVRYRVVFSNEVTGLNKGSSVLYNGIKAGDVLDLSVAVDDPAQVVALIQVDPKYPINVDTTAQLQFTGITGVGFVQLKTAKADAKPLVEAWGDSSEPPIIYAEKSTFQDLLEGAQSIMAKVDSVVTRLDTVIGENETSIRNTVRNLETFSGALADNSDKISSFITDASAAAKSLSEVGGKIETLATNLNTVVEAIQPDAVRAIVGDVRTFADALAANSDKVTVLAENAGQAAQRINDIAGRLEGVADDVRKVVQAVNPEAITRTVDNFDRITATIADKDQEITKFIDDATATAAEFRKVGARVDALLQKVDGMVGDEGGSNMIQNINEAAVSFRKLADNLNSKLDPITAGIERYGVGGLKDFQSFMAEGRRTLSNIDRALSNLESNPAGFLSGRSSVPEYNPGRRF